MSGYHPFAVLKDFSVTKTKCPHKWTKKDGKVICEVCSATGFYSKEQNKIFMKKNAHNHNISIIDIEIFNQNFKEK